MKKIAIISRSFWPASAAIGDALLLLAESLQKHSHPIVITQAARNFSENLAAGNRGEGVEFVTLTNLTDSSSRILFRVVELAIFSVFVFINLCIHRPDKVYVATNPPIFTPLVVSWYCAMFNASYCYHLQDIHPEAAYPVTGKPSWIRAFLLHLDIKTVLNASCVITLTEQMKSYIIKRVDKDLPIKLLDNPSVQVENNEDLLSINREKGFVFCGNAGRLQCIPLLLSAIKSYLDCGGRLPFVFAGGGIHAASIERLSEEYSQIKYLGILSGSDAAKLMHSYEVGLMPIEDSVTDYAFPSKSSSYLFSGCHILAICGKNTSVANWVSQHQVGFWSPPDIKSIVKLFFQIEKDKLPPLSVPAELWKQLTPKVHAVELEKILIQ